MPSGITTEGYDDVGDYVNRAEEDLAAISIMLRYACSYSCPTTLLLSQASERYKAVSQIFLCETTFAPS